jgi:hypothetical protein
MVGKRAGEPAAVVAADLDAAHDRAREAYAARDAAAYMAVFHPELQYQQLDGKVIGYAALARGVRTQLERVESAASEYRRESLESQSPQQAVEVLAQSATYRLRAFGVLHTQWHVQRSGRYEWLFTDGRWQMRRVEVLAEVVTRVRTWLAF